MRLIPKKDLFCYFFSVVAFLGLIMLLTSCDFLNSIFNPSPDPVPYPPSVNNLPTIFVSQSKAVLHARIFTQGITTSIKLEYGTTTSYGKSIICPDLIGSATSPYTGGLTTDTLTGLSQGTTYHYRFIAVNSNGTAIGDDASFTTLFKGESGIIFNSSLTYSSISDIEGNIYKTIQIGTQTWMAENLKTTTFNDGNPIIEIRNNKEWVSLTTPAYCWYENDSTTYKLSNGALYNWFAVNTGKLCPTGWHVPTDLEWTTLIYSQGGNDIALGKLQETGTTHWSNQNPRATNSSGFTALPCGFRFNVDNISGNNFYVLGYLGRWWSSSKYPPIEGIIGAWILPLSYQQYQTSIVSLTYGFYTNGFSVRCIRD